MLSHLNQRCYIINSASCNDEKQIDKTKKQLSPFPTPIVWVSLCPPSLPAATSTAHIHVYKELLSIILIEKWE